MYESYDFSGQSLNYFYYDNLCCFFVYFLFDDDVNVRLNLDFDDVLLLWRGDIYIMLEVGL